MGKSLDKLNQQIAKFNKKYDEKGQEFYYAGQDVKESAASVAAGIRRLSEGDRMGGAASVLEGLGQLTNLASFAGPFGAAAGGILSAITGIISAIMEALNPEKDSLEARIEKIVTEASLKEAKIKLSASELLWIDNGEARIAALGEAREAAAEALFAKIEPPSVTLEQIKAKLPEGVFIPEGYTIEQLAGGLSWEYLQTYIKYDERLQEIYTGLEFLKDNKETYSAQWLALLDQTVGYMYRMQISLLGLAGLVNENVGNSFTDLRKNVAKRFRAGLEEIYFTTQDMGEFYSLWHTSGNPHYEGSAFETLMSRTGLTSSKATSNESVGGEYCSTFAVSSRGTIFSSTADLTPRVGRRETEWAAAKGHQECEQIFIGEMPDTDEVIVACTHGKGLKLSLTAFNDAEGGDWENGPEEWTPNKARWGNWTLWEQSFRILSVAIQPVSGGYKVYTLGLNEDKSVDLYDIVGGKPVAVPYFHWTADAVQSELAQYFFWSFIDSQESGHVAPYPCAISFGPKLLAVQLGNSVKLQEGNQQDTWNLRAYDLLNDTSLNCYQGRFHSDGTFVCTTNTGLHLRYWNPEKLTHDWAHNSDIDSVYFWKQTGRQAELMQALYGNVVALAPKAEHA